jgi:hypothetical protein
MGQSPRNICEIVVGNELFLKGGAVRRGVFLGFARRPVREVFMTCPALFPANAPPLPTISLCTNRTHSAHSARGLSHAGEDDRASKRFIEAIERPISLGTRGLRG